MVTQKSIGLVLTIILVVFYVYFTFWVIFTPLIDRDQNIQNYFPNRIWAFIVPIYSGCVFLSLVLTFTGLALISEKHSDAKVQEYKQQMGLGPSQVHHAH